MISKNSTSRITIDLPSVDHKKLKALAAMMGKSMREVILESINELLCESHDPNETTIRAIKNVEKRKNLVKVKDLQELCKKLDI